MNEIQPTTIYLVRHGETDWNKQKKIQGLTDNPLNDEGLRQAEVLRQRFEGVVFHAAYASPLIRARRTAEIVVGGRLSVREEQAFIERDYGQFEGVPHREMRRVNDMIAAVSDELRPNYRPYPDFETDYDMIRRLVPALHDIAEAHRGENVLVGTHGGVLRVMLVHLRQIRDVDFPKIHNTAYLKIKAGEELVLDEMYGIENDH